MCKLNKSVYRSTWRDLNRPHVRELWYSHCTMSRVRSPQRWIHYSADWNWDFANDSLSDDRELSFFPIRQGGLKARDFWNAGRCGWCDDQQRWPPSQSARPPVFSGTELSQRLPLCRHPRMDSRPLPHGARLIFYPGTPSLRPVITAQTQPPQRGIPPILPRGHPRSIPRYIFRGNQPGGGPDLWLQFSASASIFASSRRARQY
jgi:hypothetical protein